MDVTAAPAGAVGPEIHAPGVRASVDVGRPSLMGWGTDEALQASAAGFSVRHIHISASTRPSSGST